MAKFPWIKTDEEDSLEEKNDNSFDEIVDTITEKSTETKEELKRLAEEKKQELLEEKKRIAEETKKEKEELKRAAEEKKQALLLEKKRLAEETKKEKEAIKAALQAEREEIKARNIAMREEKLKLIKAQKQEAEIEKEKANIRKKVGDMLVTDSVLDGLSQNRTVSQYRNAFAAIVAILEARDNYTAHHSERVTAMCENFCDILSLPSSFTNIAVTAASIHDIGKAGIQDSTLKKPGKLDDDQWDEMKSHCLIGKEILLKASPDLQFIADSISSHHERWDGSGYPLGLKGEEIPWVARLISICDSTDAMLSSRCYRRHLTEDVCIDELIKNKGTMYQPELVDIFIDNWHTIVGDLYEEVE